MSSDKIRSSNASLRRAVNLQVCKIYIKSSKTSLELSSTLIS